MRVISLVPSWTETLLEAGIEVVGRTRFCIHPSEKIKNIPAVGGTKDCNWEKVKALNPDLVLFDEEENLKEMSEACPYPWMSTHVTGIQVMPTELKKLADKFENKKLAEYSQRWEIVVREISKTSPAVNRRRRVPGVLEWLRMPEKGSSGSFAYVIWKNPWMAAGENTFIGSIFKALGFQNYFVSSKYPKFKMDEIPSDVLLLFSSEPYPFGKKHPEIGDHPAAIVDGEKYGWFGVRSLSFLETIV
jgi:ABC-type Fe3+-hydroxamate transport system substrate-binding protein